MVSQILLQSEAFYQDHQLQIILTIKIFIFIPQILT